MTALETLMERVQERRELPPPMMRRALREAAGISLQALADGCGVSRECVRLWELGRVTPRGTNLRCYLQALEVLREGGN